MVKVAPHAGPKAKLAAEPFVTVWIPGEVQIGVIYLARQIRLARKRRHVRERPVEPIDREAWRYQQRRLDVVEHRESERARNFRAINLEFKWTRAAAEQVCVFKADLLQKPLRFRPVSFTARGDIVRRG